jgi:Bacteriophage HK97-gp10, putative tail-component
MDWNDRELNKLLNSPLGEVARDLGRRGARVETAAKQYASGQGGGPQVRTGRLRSSINWFLGVDGRGVYAQVGSAVPYAPFVEEGTSRSRAYPYLRPALAFAQ